MKVLWIVNSIFPAPAKELGLTPPVFGGWMYGFADQVMKMPSLTLCVATTYDGDSLKFLEIEGVKYYLIPSPNSTKYNSLMEKYWITICNEFKPDIIQIHGTEYPHGLACIRAMPNLKYVISIQGLLSVISRTYYAGISTLEIIRNITFRDIVRRDTLFHQKVKFIKRGKYEVEMLQRTKHVIGVSIWDLANTKAINPMVNYHFCQDILRTPFYLCKEWSINNMVPHTIFLSQAGYPIKGLHIVIKALPFLVKEFPDLKLRIAGSNILKASTIGEKLRISGYGSYLNNLICKLNLKAYIEFTGPLDENQMISEFHNSNVFISPSSIENAGLSLAEAQIIGVPVIASYVGGIPNSIIDGESGLFYPFHEFELLAHKIRSIFTDTNLALKISNGGKISANQRHDRKLKLERTIQIYNEIIEE
jgi:glycosyltransferase involved in cell wall biosynthesis